MKKLSDSKRYEKKACREIIKWFNSPDHFDFLSKYLRKGSRPLLDYLEKKIPSQLLEGFEVILSESIEKCFHLSSLILSRKLVLHRYQKLGLEIQAEKQIKIQNLEPMDKVAKSFFSEHSLLAALEGASCGLGGITLAMADLPMLLTLNFRVVQQIALAYGFENQQNPELCLKILLMGFLGDSDEKRYKKWNQLNKLPSNWVNHQSEKSLAAMGKDRLFLGSMQKIISRLGFALSRQKVFAFMPLAGGAINAGINYHCTQRCAKTAYFIFRHRLLEQRGYDLSKTKIV